MMVCKEIWRWVGLRNEQPNGSGTKTTAQQPRRNKRMVESKFRMEVGSIENGTFHQPTLPGYAGSIIIYTIKIYKIYKKKKCNVDCCFRTFANKLF